MDVFVDRLYAALTDALRQSRDRPFSAPVTVAEIYQDLVPYRVVRGAIGFEMNADYEHALLQLLAGIDGLARIEPDQAANELRNELKSPNPNVGLFRKFAACDVWIADPGDAEPSLPVDQDQVDVRSATASADTHEPGAGDVFSGQRTAAAFAEEPFAPEPVDDTDAVAPADPDDDVLELDANEVVNETQPAAMRRDQPMSPSSDATPSDGPRRCAFCDTPLPAGRLIRFCPHCGADQTRRPCVECGEPLDSGWRFCIACGAGQDA